MNKWVFVAMTLCMASTNVCFSQQLQPSLPPLPELGDEVKIDLVLNEFMFAVRRGDQSTIYLMLARGTQRDDAYGLGSKASEGGFTTYNYKIVRPQ